MGFFDKITGGFMDQIRCDEPDYLIWKWHPRDAARGAVERENAIRWGSSLRVREGSAAIFIYNQQEGVIQDFIEGPYDQIIKTQNFPGLASIVGLAYEGGTPFQAEIYFINLAKIVQVRFAVPYFDVFDPRFADFAVPVAVRGMLTFNIADYREFIKLHRLDEFDLEDFQKQIRAAIARYIKPIVANIPSKNGIPVIQIERLIADINDAAAPTVSDRLRNDFGVEVSGFDISDVEIDKTSAGYRSLLSVTKDISAATIKAQAEVNIKNLQDQQRINAENLEETMRIQREEAQYAQHKQTQSSNYAAYQLETQASVGIAGAEALGHMGENGATSMSTGGGGGMDPAAMMAGMAVGGAIGQNIAGTMGNMMKGVNQVSDGTTPPPVPVTAYHVAVNGQPTGPYDIPALTQMATSGTIGADALVWKPGMANWEKASSISELKGIFGGMPPIPQQ